MESEWMESGSRGIILMFGIGNNMVQGFAIVFEKLDGHAGRINVWYEPDGDQNLFAKVRFIDAAEGVSRVVWEERTERVRSGVFGSKTQPQKKSRIKAILIRRDAHLPCASRP